MIPRPRTPANCLCETLPNERQKEIMEPLTSHRPSNRRQQHGFPDPILATLLELPKSTAPEMCGPQRSNAPITDATCGFPRRRCSSQRHELVWIATQTTTGLLHRPLPGLVIFMLAMLYFPVFECCGQTTPSCLSCANANALECDGQLRDRSDSSRRRSVLYGHALRIQDVNLSVIALFVPAVRRSD
jgi:hypothetical protein